ncbi:hypothetical protein MJO28_003342 [Puccinia striiformis f. sp. tritici]|uniref:Uncharacterized protein n=1 Tax=Puccinia striiformis f. sp. tritici TaxID=168172 RepID=A0ACC0EUI1_9BASI|nr:hypothetical protein MJO28_003342 [Puccinia striiformis f. sp. tritici]
MWYLRFTLKESGTLSRDIQTFPGQMNVDGSSGASQSNAPEAELDLYLEKPNLIVPPGKTFNILMWWAAHTN